MHAACQLETYADLTMTHGFVYPAKTPTQRQGRRNTYNFPLNNSVACLDGSHLNHVPKTGPCHLSTMISLSSVNAFVTLGRARQGLCDLRAWALGVVG